MLNEAISVLCDFAWGYWGTNWVVGGGGGGGQVSKEIDTRFCPGCEGC